MLRVIHALSTPLPTFVHPHGAVADVAKAHIVLSASCAILGYEGNSSVQHHILCNTISERIPASPAHGWRASETIPTRRKVFGFTRAIAYRQEGKQNDDDLERLRHHELSDRSASVTYLFRGGVEREK